MSVTNQQLLQKINDNERIDEKVASLERGDFFDVFNFLGVHNYNSEYSVVRCFIPGAKSVTLIDNNQHLIDSSQ